MTAELSPVVLEHLKRIEKALEQLSLQVMTLIKVHLHDQAPPVPEGKMILWDCVARDSSEHTWMGQVSARTSGEAYIRALNVAEADFAGSGGLITSMELTPTSPAA